MITRTAAFPEGRCPIERKQMKKIIYSLLLLLFASSGWAACPVGISLSMLDDTSDEKLAEVRRSGIRYVEVTFHAFTRETPEDECYLRACLLRNRIARAGLQVWSCHLPFGRGCDISVTDSLRRERNVSYIERMIRLAALFRPHRLMLHPASRPVPEHERAARERHAANSICRLSLAARRIGAVLCIENMPHSIGRTSGELLRLIEACPEVMICFDTNHLLLESHADFLTAAKGRIASVHASDYDGKDERHWLPGQGIIDWTECYRRLRRSGYRDVFLFEVRKGNATCEELVRTYKKVVRTRKKLK